MRHLNGMEWRDATAEGIMCGWRILRAGSHGTVFVPWVFPGEHPFWDRFVRYAKELAERLDPMYLIPVRKGRVAKPQDRPWSSYNNYALEKKTVAARPLRIDYVHLPESYRG